jgi:hypothetical protein
MKRFARGFLGFVALVALVAALTPGGASAAGGKKLVEGTVYDTTCPGTSCSPCPPPCGPVPAPQSRTKAICAQAAAQRRIVCPLQETARGAGPDFCVQGEPCGVAYPIYTGEGAVVNVRKRGSATALATLPIVEGHFQIRLAPGDYVFHPYLPEPQCWSGEKTIATVDPRAQSPVPATLNVSNRCVAHPDVK